MLPRLYLLIVLCLSPVLVLAEAAGESVDNADTPVNAADELRPEREKEVEKAIFKPSLEGKIYGSIRLHYRSTDQGSIFGDAGSHLGADGVFQSRAYMDFLPETWNVEPFNLSVQLQSGQPIPRLEGVKYQNAIGLSTVLELSVLVPT
jgi:hypothetical protein